MELLIGIIIGFFVGKYYSGGSTAGQSIGAINKEGHKHKEESLGKIMELFARKDEIVNDDVEHSLKVSDTTATNYLNELEEEGKIVRIGDEGRGVSYRKAERST